MPAVSPRLLLPAVLAAGLLLRLALAYLVFPGQGYAGDLRLFAGWAQALAERGPADFYGSDPSANYPPLYLYVLWVLGALAGPLASLLHVTAGQALLLLLKLPAMLADIGVAALAARVAGRWLGGAAGVVAAALYLFVPVTWYDSALWGQVDAVAALVMMAALVLLIEGHSEPAAGLAVLGVLTKPQALVCLVVVAPVLVRRHLLAGRDPLRLLTSALAAAAAAVVVLVPFDVERFAPAPLAGVPAVGDVAGLIGLVRSTADQFSVLTANAYNLWALVGPRPLVDGFSAAASSWTPDSVAVLGGEPAAVVGAALLAAVALAVAGGLLVRDGTLAIVLGFTVVAFAFYALPTRVHERYLFPVFASGAILAAGAVARAIAFAAVGLLNTLNLHAVLAAPAAFGGGFGARFGAGPPTGLRGGGGPARQGFGGGGPGFGGFGGGPGAVSVTDLHLPLAELARSPLVATAAVIGQTAALVALIGLWLVLLARAPTGGDRWPA